MRLNLEVCEGFRDHGSSDRPMFKWINVIKCRQSLRPSKYSRLMTVVIPFLLCRFGCLDCEIYDTSSNFYRYRQQHCDRKQRKDHVHKIESRRTVQTAVTLGSNKRR